MHRLPAARFLLLIVMIWGLALSPFAHALSLAAAMASPQQEAVSCHQADTERQPINDCCCHKGTACHCAVSAALPNGQSLAFTQIPAIYPVVSVSFLLHNLPPPEPPPPRRA